MDIETIKQMEVIYFLDRNAWNVNDPEALIVEMEIIEEDGQLLAYAEQGHITLQFELTDDLVAQVTEGKRKYLFETRKEARAHYNDELRKEVQVIRDMPKTTLLRQFFDEWKGECFHDIEIINAMKAKIKNEFGVDV
ncbi:hypothetical protein JUJ52_02885 [Virgibacillus sp. AGTR]|uniref:hypothetical protein n=1 Tax=Virgibacillus sp. AGTR TaxID=2812055 RepID=UPI001D160DBF|nr:hypothetical protein [Virgibacillus sp. AGTR]MCC2248902.1 hypothetical protein [Virgibacillus sp. AGTR]